MTNQTSVFSSGVLYDWGELEPQIVCQVSMIGASLSEPHISLSACLLVCLTHIIMLLYFMCVTYVNVLSKASQFYPIMLVLL